MAGALTASQLTYLAQEFAQMGELLDEFSDKCVDNEGVTDVQRADLASAETDLVAESEKIATQAIATIFDDSAAAFQSLQSITAQANAKAHDLAQEVANISKIAAIATAVLNLAVALNGGSAIAVAKALANAHSAVWS